jgi:hypothetical protein
MSRVAGALKSAIRACLRRWPALGLVAATVAFFTHEYVANRQIEPPSVNCTLAELARKVPAPVRLSIVAADPAPRLVWIGPIPRLTVRSGPPCYVLDEHGRLVEWCAQTGEGGPLDDLARAAYQQRQLSLDEASQWCKRRAREGSQEGDLGKVRGQRGHC